MSTVNRLEPSKYVQMVIAGRARRLKKAEALREHMRKSIDKIKEKADGV